MPARPLYGEPIYGNYSLIDSAKITQNIGGSSVKEIRLDERGGQGVAVSVQMLAAAFGSEGKYARRKE